NQISLSDGGANGSLTLSIPSVFSITAASLSSNFEVGGYASISGNLTVKGRADFSSNASVGGNLGPTTDASFNLGSSTRRWKSLYVSSTTIFVGDSTHQGIISYDPTANIFSFNVGLKLPVASASYIKTGGIIQVANSGATLSYSRFGS